MTSDPLSAQALFTHIQALADDIGPRPAGHPEEAQARDYIRRVLAEIGYSAIEEQPFATVDTPGYALILPHALSLAGNLLGTRGRAGALVGGLAAAAAALTTWRYSGGGRQPLEALAPKHPSANLIVRIPPRQEARHTVVLVGHTDTQKYRPPFLPQIKRFLVASLTASLGAMALNALAQLGQAAGLRPAGALARACRVTEALMIGELLRHERGAFVAGANDNATAVACLLGLGAALRAQPLDHTEVWLAFTGAEEVMDRGMHHLLDAEGERLRDAWFIDFEMVGSDEIIYVTRHSGATYLNAYRPDPESLRWAEQTAQAAPELHVHGRDIVIIEEVGALRSRGYRGICIAGVGPDGWLENWHVPGDISANIHPGGVERAARFALAMLRRRDQS